MRIIAFRFFNMGDLIFYRFWKRRAKTNDESVQRNLGNLKYEIDIYQKACNGHFVIWAEYCQKPLKDGWEILRYFLEDIKHLPNILGAF